MLSLQDFSVVLFKFGLSTLFFFCGKIFLLNDKLLIRMFAWLIWWCCALGQNKYIINYFG